MLFHVEFESARRTIAHGRVRVYRRGGRGRVSWFVCLHFLVVIWCCGGCFARIRRRRLFFPVEQSHKVGRVEHCVEVGVRVVCCGCSVWWVWGVIRTCVGLVEHVKRAVERGLIVEGLSIRGHVQTLIENRVKQRVVYRTRRKTELCCRRLKKKFFVNIFMNFNTLFH